MKFENKRIIIYLKTEMKSSRESKWQRLKLWWKTTYLIYRNSVLVPLSISPYISTFSLLTISLDNISRTRTKSRKGFSPNLNAGSAGWQSYDDSRKIQLAKHCGDNNKHENNGSNGSNVKKETTYYLRWDEHVYIDGNALKKSINN